MITFLNSLTMHLDGCWSLRALLSSLLEHLLPWCPRSDALLLHEQVMSTQWTRSWRTC
jgi:hypothetical protein